MATDRTAIAKKLLGVLIIVSFLLVVTAYGGAVLSTSPGDPSQGGTQPSPAVVRQDTGSGGITGTPGSENSLRGNSDSANFGNGNSGSSRPDGVGAGKEGAGGNTAGNVGNTSASGSPAGQVTASPVGPHGTNVTSTGTAQEIMVDTRAAKEANETVSVEGTAVSIAKGPVTLTITTPAEPNVQNGTITAGVKSISMKYAPVTAQFTGTGTVSASFTADLMHLPSQNATIAVSLAEKPDPLVQAAFDSAVKKTGYQMDAIAYTLNVAKTNLNDGREIGIATVNMSISPSWITAHGGVGQVKIARYADDGTSQVLDTRSAGPDSSGNMVFTGTSPGGLSIFALVSVKTTPVAAAAITPQPTSPSSLPFTGANSLLLVPPLFVFIIVIFMRQRR